MAKDQKPITSQELREELERYTEKLDKTLGLEYDEFALSQQHNSETGQRNEVSEKYLANTTPQNYVYLRRRHPHSLIEIADSWAIDWVFANQKLLEAHNIHPRIVVSCLDADPAAISELSLNLLEHLIKRADKIKNGETHLQGRGKSISDSLVNYLIAMMLDALDWNNDLHIPRDLIVLIKHQLGSQKSHEARSMEAHKDRERATMIAASLKNAGKNYSMRNVAKILRVSPSTVSRWFKDVNYEAEIEKFAMALEAFEIKSQKSSRRK